MPELPEVESVRRRLAPAMTGALFLGVTVRRANLRTPFPVDFASRLVGHTALAVERRAKYLLVPLSSGETLVMHLGMSGWFEVSRRRSEPERHDHVIFDMSSGAIVTFTDPRRFGFMDLVATDSLGSNRAIGALGPEPLSRGFDAAALGRALRGRKTPLKSALLDQSVVAGLGNIYAVEALHLAALSPMRRAGTLVTTAGEPRDTAVRLTEAIKEVLTAAIRRQSRRTYRGDRFRVYDREGEPCPRRGCTGTIRRRTQAGRSTFYCPVCQK